jgi:hypothetical protein
VAFVLYGVETSGLNKRLDQILEFAAVRTDADLVETDRFETRSLVRTSSRRHYTCLSEDSSYRSFQTGFAVLHNHGTQPKSAGC